MHRFFIPKDAFQAESVLFPDESANQIRRVLRLRDGERVAVLDGEGRAFEVSVLTAGKAVIGKIERPLPADHEVPYQLTLLAPLTRREKFEYLLQKCTEAGVTRFLPTVSERSLVQDPHDADEKRSRWEKILKEAAEQSGRDRIPSLMNAQHLREALMIPTASESIKLIFWEEADSGSALRKVFAARRSTVPVADVVLAVGPEGGYSEAEVDFARDHGWQVVSLGKRIYRMETAALASVVLTNYGLES